MKRAAAALGAVLLVVAPASAGVGAQSPTQKVVSKDGGLTVSVPRGALKKHVKVRIRVLNPGQYPPELRNASFRPGTRLYALEPAGLKFRKPVTITRRIDADVSGFDVNAAAPVITLALTDGGRNWEMLSKLTLRVSGKTIAISGTTRHFSTVVAFDEAVRATLVPPSVDAAVGSTWDALVRNEIDNRRRSDPIEVEEQRWFSGGVVRNQSDRSRTFECERAGSGTYNAAVVYAISSLAETILGLDFAGEGATRETVYLGAPAVCRQRPPTQLELAFACVVVAHSSLGQYPSFTRWLLRVTGQLPSNAQASLTAGGVNGGQPVGGTMNLATGAIEFTGGISSFGQKPVQNLTVAGQNLTQQLVAKVGTPNVTAAQGTIAGQCPP